ncbi:MAG: DNA repair protein RecO [Alphaproteobacteria bacterium]|nr:DNA repair protein RecO [Alphaproteobacteria bacterium]
MRWEEEAIVLARRPHGETSLLVSVLTPSHGRHVGLVKGGRSSRYRGQIEPGNRVQAVWQARLSEHLGNFGVELMRDRAGPLLQDGLALSALSALCALVEACLAEREPHPAVYAALDIAIDALEDPEIWPVLMVRFELGLLAELGFGLELGRCAVTGRTDTLTHVSPRTGRAVAAEVAARYEGRLLPLPAFLLGGQAGPRGPLEVLDGLRLTGSFLNRWLFEPQDRELPPPRAALPDRLARHFGLAEAPAGAG